VERIDAKQDVLPFLDENEVEAGECGQLCAKLLADLYRDLTGILHGELI
jgi:hypothetical protein